MGFFNSRFVTELHLTPEVASQLVAEESFLRFFEACVEAGRPGSSAVAANLILNDLPVVLRQSEMGGRSPGSQEDAWPGWKADETLSFGRLTPESLARLADLKESGELPHNLVFTGLEILVDGGASSVDEVLSSRGWTGGAPRDPVALKREAEAVLEAMPVVALRAKAAASAGKEKKFRRAMAELLEEAGRRARTRLDMKMLAETLAREVRKGRD